MITFKKINNGSKREYELYLGNTTPTGIFWPPQIAIDFDPTKQFGVDIEVEAFKAITTELCDSFPAFDFDKGRTQLEIVVALTDARRL